MTQQEMDLLAEENSRDALTRAIRDHIHADRLDKVLSMSRVARTDALESLLKDAVRHAGVVSFSGIPHVWVRRYGIYMPFDYSVMKIAVYDAMRKSGVPDGCYGTIERIVKLCWAEVQSTRKDVDTAIVVMDNGVFDTMDMCMHDYSSAYMTNMRVDYRYNPNDVPVNWYAFLNRVLPDPELQMLLQEFLAASYVDRRYAKIEQMMILLGSGANGKSVVFEVVSALLGESNMSNFSVSDLIASTRKDQNIALCNGKRLNYCSEIQTQEICAKNADSFKALVSGEPVMARTLYKEPFRASSIPLIMANANGMPRLEDASYALQRRILVLPFDVFIPENEQDRELASTLKKELSGIFNWVMVGLQRLRASKYQISVPLRVKEYVREYVKENNTVQKWMDECGIIPHYRNRDSAERWATTMEMFAMFESWRMKVGEQPMHRKAFYAELDMLGFRRRRMSNGMGFEYFKLPGKDELFKLNLDLALRMEQKNAVEQLRKQVSESGVVEITSVSDLERYLGLPQDSIWAHMQNGALRDCYKKMPDGKKLYDVRAVQMKLAECGFYQSITRDNSLHVKSKNALRGMRKTFNSQMKMMGVPIRKHGNVNGYIPVADIDCWFVPDDWEYSEKAAERVMAGDKKATVIDLRGDSADNRSMDRDNR